jgi:hypothetical protein
MSKVNKIRTIILHKAIDGWGVDISISDGFALVVDDNNLGVWVVPEQEPEKPTLVPWSSIHYAPADQVAVEEPPAKAKPLRTKRQRKAKGA